MERLSAAAFAMRLDEAWQRADTFALTPAGPTPPTLELPATLSKAHLVLQTSGSTGAPRQVVLSRQRAAALAEAIAVAQAASDVESVVLALPLHHAFGLVNQWLLARAIGRPLVPTAGFADPVALAEALDASPRSMVCLVGAQAKLLAHLYGDRSFPHVQAVHFAGGPFPVGEWSTLRRVFPEAAFTNNYGCTEAGPRLTVRPVASAEDGEDVGLPLPGVELRVGQRGTVEFRSPFQAVALADAPGGAGAPTAAVLVGDDAWLDTGDEGAVATGGRWRIAGRRGEVLKRHGVKVVLSEVLAQLRTAWSGAAMCLREPDERGEDGYVLALSPPPRDEELRAVLRLIRDLPRAAWPLAIDTMDFPGEGGKVAAAEALAAPRTRLWRQR